MSAEENGGGGMPMVDALRMAVQQTATLIDECDIPIKFEIVAFEQVLAKILEQFGEPTN